MRNFLRQTTGNLLKRLARFRAIQNLLNAPSTGISDFRQFLPMGEFVATNGRRFTLLAGYRDSIVPGWEEMLKPALDRFSREIVAKKIKETRAAIRNLEMFLQLHGFSLVDKLVLEVGCYWGIHAYLMAEMGTARVHGIDIPEYGIRQEPDTSLSDERLEIQSKWLGYLRKEASKFFDTSCTSRVSFEDCDVANLTEGSTYDAVISWETMEHVNNPGRAFLKIYEALKPGGFCFHEYNPFFCEQGGHSLCTLDFPYGHCRLSSSDFKRYIKTLRPQEEKAAISFYEDNLNRITLADVKSYALNSGFNIVSFLPWLSKAKIPTVSREILLQTKELYPTVHDEDLLANIVWLLVRKPE